MSAAPRSTARADSRNSSSGLERTCDAWMSGVKVSIERGPGCALIGAIRAGLQGGEERRLAGERHIRIHLALEQLAHQCDAAAIDLMCATTSLTSTRAMEVASLGA